MNGNAKFKILINAYFVRCFDENEFQSCFDHESCLIRMNFEFTHSIPIRSNSLEQIFSKICKNLKKNVYSICLRTFFRLLCSLKECGF